MQNVRLLFICLLFAAPGQSAECMVIFTPIALAKVRETIKFQIDNLYPVNVAIAGEGVVARLELVS